MGYVLLSARTELLELKVPEVYHVKADGIIFMRVFCLCFTADIEEWKRKRRMTSAAVT